MVIHRSLLQIILIVVSLHAYSAEKRALLVAVINYPANSSWHKLSSANNANLMSTTLKFQEFEDRNIGTLINQKATKANILKSLDLLVASEKQLDLSPIVTKLPVKNRSNLPTEFEQMISDLFEAEKNRGTGSYSKINIFTRTFTIKEK